jgi:putative transposase
MPRRGRLIPQDGAMHIMCRGNNKKIIFHQEKDKLYYYSLLLNLKEENNIEINHYCLMNNHNHLIVWLNPRSILSKFMKQVNLSYFHYYKKKYGYYGHFWQDRFKSNIIDTDSYLICCGKYIELNPVRAEIVKLPEEYAFSSYGYYSKGLYDSLVNPSPVYMELSDSEEERKKLYTEFILTSNLINSKILTEQLFIGGREFIKKTEQHFNIKNVKLSKGRPKKLPKNRTVPN